MVQLPFANRTEAGRFLGEKLASLRRWDRAIVLALPRGGVPVGFAVASALNLPLDVLVVRKLGAPGQPELAMGAIAGNGVRILDQSLIQQLGISGREIETVASREAIEAKRREQLYRRDKAAADVRGQTVILVDDGLATGASMRAAVESIVAFRPASVVVAVPVGSVHACRQMRAHVNEVVCLATPEPFYAVGEWYVDFQEVTDAEVRSLLERADREAESRKEVNENPTRGRLFTES
jgi:putative phosphoribosyl transferase